MRLQLPIHSYAHRSTPASSARLVNCFPEGLPPDAKTPVLLTRSPGIATWATVGDGPIRGLYTAAIELTTGYAEYLYVVSGSKLYYVTSAGAATLLGDVGTGGRVDMSSNTSAVVVVNEPRAFFFDGTILTGTHSAAGNNATVLTDATRGDTTDAFVEDALIGYRISNTTDGSEGIIIDNDETTVTVSQLQGGTDNDWDTSDAYVITGFSEILDDDFVSRGAGDVEFVDDFMLFREPNSGRFFGADIGTVADFDALQFAIADSATDNLDGMIVSLRSVVNFGPKSGEIWENTGVAGFPFERLINGVFDEGCLNANTIAGQDNSVYWVANDYTVRRLEGITPVRVSTHPIEQKITAATTASLTGFAYEQEGHFFYVVSAIEGTWVLDITTGEWSERQSYGELYWKPQHQARFAGKERLGDAYSNKVGYLDPDTYADWGTTQRMEWTYQPVYAEGQRAFHDRLEIVMETGVGLTTGQGSDPKIMLQKSDDGGKTWQALPDKSIGKLGERLSRAVWHNLGSARQRVYRAAISDPIAVTVTDTVLEVKGGRL